MNSHGICAADALWAMRSGLATVFGMSIETPGKPVVGVTMGRPWRPRT